MGYKYQNKLDEENRKAWLSRFSRRQQIAIVLIERILLCLLALIVLVNGLGWILQLLISALRSLFNL